MIRIKSILPFKITLCFLVLFVGFSLTCQAACQLSQGTNVYVSMPLSTKNISIGADAPVGTVIYRQTFIPSAGASVTCDVNSDLILSFIATGSYSSYSGPAPYDNVYDIGYPGIGLVIWNVRHQLSYGFRNFSSKTLASNVLSATVEKEEIQTEISLIKTGDIAAGVINGSTFPSTTLKLKMGSTTDNILFLSFTGTLNITLPTCTTPDYSVNLGNWGTSRFTAKGATSPWIDSTIQLSGCGQFAGFISDNAGTSNSWSDTGTSSLAPHESNQWQLSLSSVYGVTDASNGIITTDGSANGAAQGIGIQLSRGRPDIAGQNLVAIGSNAFSGNFTDSGTPSFAIPLSARMIQTEDQITAGSVNGKVVYTLSYL